MLTNFVNFSGGSEQSRSLTVDGNPASARDVNSEKKAKTKSMNEQTFRRFGE